MVSVDQMRREIEMETNARLSDIERKLQESQQSLVQQFQQHLQQQLQAQQQQLMLSVQNQFKQQGAFTEQTNPLQA